MAANVKQVDITDYLEAAPQLAEYAQRFGPFFFGVMLVLVGVYMSHAARRDLGIARALRERGGPAPLGTRAGDR